MDKLIPVGRVFFAIALIGLGIEHFIFNEFVTGRAPAWPESIAGGRIWAYLTGMVFVVTGAAILFGKKPRPAAFLAAGLIFFWALLRHVPVLAAESLLSGAWTKAGKALAFVGGLLAIAATFPKMEAGRYAPLSKLMNRERELIIVGRVCLGLFLVLTGIQHFMFTEFVASLIPGWFPGDAIFWTHFAGVALIAGGIGLFVPPTARLAALLSGLMVFSWFWIVHIPRAFVSVSDSIAVFEALAVSGIALVLAGIDGRKELRT
jgi:uncharacterized membrane protein